MVTLIQRFGSALNLNIHFHMLFLDGGYLTASRRLRFVLVRDAESAYLQWDEARASPLDELLGAAITYIGLP